MKKTYTNDTDTLFSATVEGSGRITVLDRMTGYGNGQRDIETGFTDEQDKFWLASCGFDIRNYPHLDIDQAIEFIKQIANTCKGE